MGMLNLSGRWRQLDDGPTPARIWTHQGLDVGEYKAGTQDSPDPAEALLTASHDRLTDWGVDVLTDRVVT